MVKSVKFFLMYMLLISSILYNKVMAGGFTSGKGKYDFTIEYEGAFKNNSKGTRNGVFTQDIEINNEFGITENQSIAVDFFFATEYQYSDPSNGIKRDAGIWYESAAVRHRATLAKIGNFGFGVQNTLLFDDKGDGNYKARWALRLMARHDNPTGFYKHFRVEVENRRWFNATTSDEVRLDLRARFRIVESVDLYVRYLSFFKFASISYLNTLRDGSNQSQDTNAYFFKGNGDVKVAKSEIYVGPEWKLVNDQMVYVYGTMRLDGRGASNRNRRQGLLFGYSKGFDL